MKNLKPKDNSGRNVFIIIVLCIAVITGVYWHNSVEKEKIIEQGGAHAVSVQLKEVQHGVTKLTATNVDYLKNSKEYGGSFKKGKTIVIYPYPGDRSPFSPMFSKAFDEIMNNPKYASIYEFMTFPETANNQFFKNCHSFCIVNSKKHELFYIVRTGNAAAKQLPLIFDGLKDW